MNRVVVMSIISLSAGSSNIAGWVGMPGRIVSATARFQISDCSSASSARLVDVAALSAELR